MGFRYVVGDRVGSDSIVGIYLAKPDNLALDNFFKKHSNTKFSKVSVFEKDQVDGYELCMNKKKNIRF